MSISNMIERIRKRPGMYLGSNNIIALWHFLNGYKFAERDSGVECNGTLFPLNFKYMSEFANVQLNCTNNLGWCHNILNFCNGNEDIALNKFFELYDEFNQVSMKGYWKAVLNEQNIYCNNSMERGYSMKGNGREPMFKNPIAVYVIKLTIPAYILAIETSEDIRVEPQFFASDEQAKGHGIPFGAESYFGEITMWEEYIASHIEFQKNIILH